MRSASSAALLAILAAAAAAACGNSSGDDDGYNGHPACGSDADCGSGDLCARDETCWDADDVEAVKITWTFDGSAASDATCTSFPYLYVEFISYSYSFEFSPVPCNAGEFPIDKLPTIYTEVQIGDLNEMYFQQSAQITGSAVAFDLQP